jgi:BlaI family transcriptional regulator, penicillinase repressor
LVFVVAENRQETMPRKPSNQLNDVELAILRVLWERGPSTVGQVHAALQDTRDAGYTSTSKMMQVMLDKGLLKRDRNKRPHQYRSAVPQEQTQGRIVHDLIHRVFGGSVQNLVLRAVHTQRISRAELAEIKALLDSLEGDKP